MGGPADKKYQNTQEGRKILLITTSGERVGITAVTDRVVHISEATMLCKQQVRVSITLGDKMPQRPLLFRGIK